HLWKQAVHRDALRALVAASGSLVGYAPGNPARLNLDEWRKGLRLQQVAFDLAKVLAIKWMEERGDNIPIDRLFPQMLETASRFIDTRVECVGTRAEAGHCHRPLFRAGDSHVGQRDGSSRQGRCEPGAP